MGIRILQNFDIRPFIPSDQPQLNHRIPDQYMVDRVMVRNGERGGSYFRDARSIRQNVRKTEGN